MKPLFLTGCFEDTSSSWAGVLLQTNMTVEEYYLLGYNAV
jgi:hypothetical protein